MMEIVMAIILGSLFGFALYYAGAAKRKNIRAMLRLEDLTLMRIIVYAIGYASVLMGIVAMAGFFDVSHFQVKTMNAGVVLGGLIFGIGFGFAGGCPGTSLAALPYGNKVKTVGLIVGGLVGALLFTLSQGWWQELGLFQLMDIGKVTLFNISPKYPSLFSLGYGGLLLFGLILMGVSWLIPKKIL